MDNFMELVKTRRSILRFQDKPVSDEVLGELFETVRWSQSWANTQCWEIVIVKNSEKRQAIQDAIKKV